MFISEAPGGQTQLIRIYIHAAAQLQREGVNGSFGIDVIDSLYFTYTGVSQHSSFANDKAQATVTVQNAEQALISSSSFHLAV